MSISSFPAILVAALALGSSVCEARRLSRRDCTITWPAIEGDTCATMARDWALEVDFFRAMNPTADCSKLIPGQEYCVDWEGTRPTAPAITSTTPPTVPPSTTLVTKTSSAPPTGPTGPSPVQEGITPNCKQFYRVSSSDTCQKIVDSYKTFTLQQFYTWNPAVGTACGSLWPDYYVCVGVPGTPSTATTTKTTSTSTAASVPSAPPPQLCRWNPSKGQYDCPGMWPAPPGPTQAGVALNCVKWVLQKDGVFCFDMAKMANIALDRLYEMNPALGSNCVGLWPGYAYCIATGQ